MKAPRYWFIPLSLSLGLTLALVLVWAASSRGAPALAAPPASPSQPSGARAPAAEWHVCSTCPYSSIQAAVDAASDGDIIKVAADTYTDLHMRPKRDITTTGFVAQIVYLSKTVTIQGGYTPMDWSVYNPEGNPTILDAGKNGRVFYVTGDISPTLQGLRIRNGNAAGLGGHLGPVFLDAGGGIYAISATLTLSRCQISTGTATFGGGLYAYNGAVTLNGNTFYNNSASEGYGGGLLLYSTMASLHGNSIYGNKAKYSGGLGIAKSVNVILNRNTIAENVASSGGGGIQVGDSTVALIGNTISANIASTGGGLEVVDGAAVDLQANVIQSNHAITGGGAYIASGAPFTLTNNIVAQNTAATTADGLWVSGAGIEFSQGRLRHNTIADNKADGLGIGVGPSATLRFTNTIVAGHSIGVSVTASSSIAEMDHTLWNNNINWIGTVNNTNGILGNPAFAGGGDYHITSGSAALDAGIDAGVAMDIDGQTRPLRGGFDIGADEWTCTALTTVLIDGPAAGYLGAAYLFTATVQPPTATPPITYTWNATQQGRVITGANAISFTWTSTGVKTILVTATNDCGTLAVGVHNIIISAVTNAVQDVTLGGPRLGAVGAAYAFTAMVDPPTATPPITYTWQVAGRPAAQCTGGISSTAIFTWSASGQQVITVTARNAGGVATDTHDIMISSGELINQTGGRFVIYTDTHGLTTTAEFPADAVTETIALVYTPVLSPTEPVSPGLKGVGHAFDLGVDRAGGRQSSFTFLKPITLTIHYWPDDVRGVKEDTLALYRWVALLERWQIVGTRPRETQSLDADNNVLTAQLIGLTRFRTMGIGEFTVYLPVVIK